ncbi:acetyl-CoA carboxylase carboxyl transferase subunit alpha [Nocardiopsis alba]|uniref:Multifunctional fusion protein n=1 Tax=Nocardiopsis alba TaxID=53437 RepID=A0A7K2IPC2_9ACTN|nr:acetyl-CoA carboxylase carboxyl transferase subunit alpha [Nocardiopsis alba]MYR31677.1 acetyl-CoA carboxylase carboxyl transferase subunit alpha [Nocardiopsis alba]
MTSAATTEWIACGGCAQPVYGKRFARTEKVCPLCGWHAPLSAVERITSLFDEGSARPLPWVETTEDPLGFSDTTPYSARLAKARDATGAREAILCVRATIMGHPLIAAVMDFAFLGGSMGTAVGEAIAGAAETALHDRVPLLVVTASGGARMQESILSLMQMAVTARAFADLDAAGILSLGLITDPTYGGVAASFAALPDVLIAEQGARMGFAGPRVIRQTIGAELPKGFQTAEFLTDHGFIDMVRPRGALRHTLARLLDVWAARTTPPKPVEPVPGAPFTVHKPSDLADVDPWQVVRDARDPRRPTSADYVTELVQGFEELRGDRVSGDCSAIIGGFGLLQGMPVLVLGHQKGHETDELVQRNFGMASPQGYRKTTRLMRLAAKLKVPVLTFIDTPGAYPGITAEEDGQSFAIAENLRVMSSLPVPIVSVITGEGGSGGALALGVADRVLALSGSCYSVISPEGCAAILWKSPQEAPLAARALRIRARDLLGSEVVDAVVPEPPSGAAEDGAAMARALEGAVVEAFLELIETDPENLTAIRRRRFRKFANHIDKGEL